MDMDKTLKFIPRHHGTPRMKIIEALRQADQIKAANPNSGVTADAIFAALVAQKSARKPRSPIAAGEPPEWFTETVKGFAGREVTVGEFTVLAGVAPLGRADKNKVGAWLRAGGRVPRRTGGRQVFRL